MPGRRTSAGGGELDAGPRCTSDAECDDGQPCTDDRCVPTAGCLHDDNTATCDDGVLCNGSDTCRAGGCREHDFVDPCPGMSSCDTASDTCMGCESDADCPTEMTGDWGACTFPPGDLCTTAGTRERTITAYQCVASVCEPRPRTESEACARATDGVSCGTRVGGAWSACVYAEPTCSTTGTRSRTVFHGG